MLSSDTFEIRLPQFEGPFDLLLFFIERDELDIQTISIAAIAGEFLDYIHTMHSLNIELASEFIVVAATLMRIKAKLLLPRYTTTDDDEPDPQQDLIQRLIIYKKFKEVAEDMKLLEEARFMQEKRGTIAADTALAGEHVEPGEELSSVDLYRLMLVYERLLARNHDRGETVTHTVIQYPYSIEKQKTMIAGLLQINARLDFRNLKDSAGNRVEFIYNFLAILEMLQQELISIQVGLGYNNFWIAGKHNEKAPIK